MKRLATCLGVLVALSVVSSGIEHRALWGFWLSRPSLLSAVEGAEAVRGFSVLHFENGQVTPRSDRQEAFEQLKRRGGSSEELLGEVRLVERLSRTQGSVDRLPEISLATLQRAWAELREKGWLPQVRDPRYKDSGVPVSGLAAQILKGNAEYLLLVFRTSEIANDRYAYSEVLFGNLDSGPSLLKQERFYYEIAGMEGLGYALLLPINLAFFLLCYIAFRFVRTLAMRIKADPAVREVRT